LKSGNFKAVGILTPANSEIVGALKYADLEASLAASEMAPTEAVLAASETDFTEEVKESNFFAVLLTTVLLTQALLAFFARILSIGHS